MLHHISISVADLQTSSRFYDALLKPLGYSQVCAGKFFVGYGAEKNKDQFALKKCLDRVSKPSPGFHIAFSAPNRSTVDQSYAAAVTLGTGNGAPGIREHYGPTYYAAFLIDPDGYEVEVVNTSGSTVKVTSR